MQGTTIKIDTPLQGPWVRKTKGSGKPKRTQQLRFPLPAILKPDFDLFGFNVWQNGTITDQLLPTQRAWLRTFGINPFERFNLLGGVPDVFSCIEMLIIAITAALSVLVLSHSHRHFRNPLQFVTHWAEEEKKMKGPQGCSNSKETVRGGFCWS